MKPINEVIKLLTPPIIISLYRRFKKTNGSILFSGVYSSVDEINDENPWVQKPWIELSKMKLDRVRKVSSNSFMPTSDFAGYSILPCLIVNLLSQSKPCNILDFGGGTGFTYFTISPYLLNPENVTYHVVDSNLELFKIGKRRAESMGSSSRIVFHTEIPKKSDIQLDILYINTSLQYIYDYSSLLVTLLRYKPQYVILTKLISGDMKTYITCQNIHGYTTPSIFINFQEIIDIFSENGFDLIFKSPCSEEVFEEVYDSNIPKDLHIRNTSNLIFKRLN